MKSCYFEFEIKIRVLLIETMIKLAKWFYQILELQRNLSKADSYGTEVFVSFREVSALDRFELKSSKVPQFKVQLFYTGSTLTRFPPPPYLTMGMWNGEKEVNFFVMYQFILHQSLK